MKNLGCTLSGTVTGIFAPLGRAGRYVAYHMEKAVEMTMISSLVTKLTGWASNSLSGAQGRLQTLTASAN